MPSYRSIFRPDLFAGHTHLITGGGSGIGRCVAHELASLGAHVVLAGRRSDKLERVRDELGTERATAIQVDIRDEAQVERLFEQIERQRGTLHGLVNNAGGQYVSPAASIEKRGFEAVVATNLTGTWLMCRAVHARFFSKSGGAIVNMLADMFRGMPMMAHSGAARAGVENLTRTLALEWASEHVRVNAVAPGIIRSSGLETYPEPVREAMAALPRELPMGRLGTEAEVSSAVVFLLSPGARYVSGATLRVDGGSSLYRHPFALPSGSPSPSFDGFEGEDD